MVCANLEINFLVNDQQTTMSNTADHKRTACHKRTTAAYNVAKSLMLAEFSPTKARVLDLGCGNGNDMIKFGCRRPEYVVFVDASPECISNARCFAQARGISYAYSCENINFIEEAFSTLSVLVRNAKMSAPRRVLLSNLDIVTTFSSLEYCRSTEDLHFICSQIYRSLKPGGVWIGCLTDGEKLIKRCGGSYVYEDDYCQIAIQSDSSYLFKIHGKAPVSQTLISVAWLSTIAAFYGLVLIKSESLLDSIGNAENSHDYRRLRHASGLNRECRLRMDDLRPLSLLDFFVFKKPLLV